MISSLLVLAGIAFGASVPLRAPVPFVKCPLDSIFKKDITNPPRAEYPRMQMQRDEDTTYATLNGAWEWQPATPGEAPFFGAPLNSSINVPFPVESCLSGVNETHMAMWYRLVVDRPAEFPSGGLVRLHFEAVDWQTSVWLNGELLGNHTGGYSHFSYSLPTFQATGNEILVYVFDPSDTGPQPMGKQRLSALIAPSGDHYTPSSGIWGPVWLEHVPTTFISSLKITPTLTDVTINVTTETASGPVTEQPFQVTAMDASGATVASGSGTSGVPIRLAIPSPQHWSHENPYLYNLSVTSGSDSVMSYFGLRTMALCKDGNDVTRPCLNGKPIYMSGWLDQAWYPDGQYSSPSLSGIEFDVTAAATVGLNTVRVHQKVRSDRYYYKADKVGLLVWQDMVQHFGANPSQELFESDMVYTVRDLYNHPSIIQWDIFNERDCVTSFDVPAVVQRFRELDNTRLVDTNSGGPSEKVDSDVYDQHDYPSPKPNQPDDNAYAADGEFAGIGFYPPSSQQYFPGRCYAYMGASSAQEFANDVVGMVNQARSYANLSAIILTQLTDLESECDGIFAYTRDVKFNASQNAAVAAANAAFINRT